MCKCFENYTSLILHGQLIFKKKIAYKFINIRQFSRKKEEAVLLKTGNLVQIFKNQIMHDQKNYLEI